MSEDKMPKLTITAELSDNGFRIRTIDPLLNHLDSDGKVSLDYPLKRFRELLEDAIADTPRNFGQEMNLLIEELREKGRGSMSREARQRVVEEENRQRQSLPKNEK